LTGKDVKPRLEELRRSHVPFIFPSRSKNSLMIFSDGNIVIESGD
jgi:hypothetical protein